MHGCMDLCAWMHACMRVNVCTKWMQYFCTNQVGFMFFWIKTIFYPGFDSEITRLSHQNRHVGWIKGHATYPVAQDIAKRKRNTKLVQPPVNHKPGLKGMWGGNTILISRSGTGASHQPRPNWTSELDDGWPESVEEQGLLLLVWRHQMTGQYIEDVL